MSQYFYLDDKQQQHGPCTVEELQAAGIRRDTKVWSAGMSDWADAESVPGLQQIFVLVPPSAKTEPSLRQDEQAMRKPDSWLAWSIISLVLCCWPLSIPAIVYAAKVDGQWRDKQYDEAMLSARRARQWTIASAVAGFSFWLIYGLLVLFGVVTGLFSGLSSSGLY